MRRALQTMALVLAAGAAQAAEEPIKIAHVYGKTGPMQAYAQQLHRGLRLGFDYATNGSNKVLGREIVIIEKDTHLKPERGRTLVAEAFGEDDADLVVGPVSSAVALAALPIAAEYEKIIMPQGVADSITGENWNRYVVRVTRSSTQDAIASAVAVGGRGSCIATLAQDYAFGRDGVKAFKAAAEKTGAKVIHEEYVPQDASDFTAPAQRIFDSFAGKDCKNRYLWPLWAGAGNPLGKIQDLQPQRHGISISTGGNILAAMQTMKPFAGSEGAVYYYYELPNNPVNDWLVKEHFRRYNSPPDFFTAQGMAEAMAIVAALEKAKSTDTDKLIEAFEGLRFQSPKGEMYIRPEDHQTMQVMYHTRLVNKSDVAWVVPTLVRELKPEEMDVPVLNKR
jgi:branched-chain amino acid transport system substrate-binding protein